MPRRYISTIVKRAGLSIWMLVEVTVAYRYAELGDFAKAEELLRKAEEIAQDEQKRALRTAADEFAGLKKRGAPEQE